jgi:peptide/nickel transport system substrate-binding protein
MGRRAWLKHPVPFVCVAVVSLGALLAGCGGGGSSDNGQRKSAGTSASVTMKISGPVTSLDPVKGSSIADGIAAWALYSPLVTLNQQGKIIPGLAESWTTTPTSATFRIKKGVTCSDGTPVTPAVVAASLRRFFNPATAAPTAGVVLGAGNTAKVSASNTAGTVTVSLAHPWSQLVGGLTLPFAGIVCPAGLKDPKSLTTRSNGTGPYVTQSEVSGATYTFGQRPGYAWGPAYDGQPSGTIPHALVLKVVQDENTAANLMAGGSLQIGEFDTDAWTRFRGRPGYSSVTQPATDTMLVFNESPGHPAANNSVRLAVAQALNRSTLNDIMGNRHGELESNLGQSTYECYDPSLSGSIPAQDTAAASRVLRGVHLRIIGTTGVAAGTGTTYLEAALRHAGAAAKLQNMDNEAWNKAIFSGQGNWDVTILGIGNITNSFLGVAAGFFVGPAPPKGLNIGNVQNPAATKAFATGSTASGSATCNAVATFQRALIQRNDVVPLTGIPATVVFGGGAAAVAVKGLVMPSAVRIANH